MPISTTVQVAANEAQRFYDWALHSRMLLVPTTRKVHRDFSLLAAQEPEGPAILAILEGILKEAGRWHDRAVGTTPWSGANEPGLPPEVPLESIVSWADGLDLLFSAVGHLGTWCHFKLKEHRKRQAADDGSDRKPLLSPQQYQELKRKNLLANNLEILLGRSSLASYPLRLELDPTNECNLRCRGCRHGITKDFHHVEFHRDYVEIFSEALPFADYMYPIGTGEPTMSSTLPLLINEAHRHGVKVDMLTNGTVLEIATLPWEKFFRLGISVDGASEEIMRALRPVAPLAHVLKSLAELRAKAPQATIYTKVTVSRMNFDELPALMDKLAEVGVNEVIVHSLDVFHPVHEFIQVRTNDRQHMMECVEAARQAAERRGMKFVNALNFSVARNDGKALDKAEMFQMLKDSPLPVLQIRDLSTILEMLERYEFRYYPEDLVKAARLAPAPTPPVPPQRPEPIRIDTIDQTIRDLVRQVRSLTPEQVQIPYCFLPWKMSIVEADGRSRPCCHLSGHVDDVDQGTEFQDFWSGPGYVALRESMFKTEKLPKGCVHCEEFDRSAYSDDAFAVADMLGVPVRQFKNHPAPVDVKRLLSSSKEKRSGFEPLGATLINSETFLLPPGAQILARFPNPKNSSGVYYQGQFRITGGRLLVGVKPLWADDLWHYMLEAGSTELLGEWTGLPMPPLTVDFTNRPEVECCVFLWAPSDNPGKVEVRVKEFSGVVTAPGPNCGDSLQGRHFWSGHTADRFITGEAAG